MKLAPAQLHCLSELNLKRGSTLTQAAVYKDHHKSKSKDEQTR